MKISKRIGYSVNVVTIMLSKNKRIMKNAFIHDLEGFFVKGFYCVVLYAIKFVRAALYKQLTVHCEYPNIFLIVDFFKPQFV